MLSIIENVRNELVEFTQEIIKIPSFTGNEGDHARIVLKKLQEIDVDDTFVDGIGNVIGIIKGEGKGPNIMLNGHLDVVPPGNLEDWRGYDPFGAKIDEDGNIRGRGAADLKGGLSVQLYTMKLLMDLKKQGVTIPGDLIFSAVVHEEAAETFGMSYLLKKTLPEKKLSCDVVFLCEPTNLNIMLGHRGKVEIVIKTRGKTAHSSRPHAGINAIQKMVPILEKIFNEIGKDDYKHPLLGDRCFAVTNIESKPAGYSIVPDECEISIDQRYFPDEKVTDMIIKYEKIIAKIQKEDPGCNASVEIRKIHEKSYTGYEKTVQKYLPPWITDENDPFVQKTLQALKRIGQTPKIGYWEGGTDGSMSKSILGIPTIGYSGMEHRYAHTAEDMVSIDKMLLSFEGYLSIVCELFDIKNLF
jgi:putative selenium metabolism hydrolase